MTLWRRLHLDPDRLEELADETRRAASILREEWERVAPSVQRATARLGRGTAQRELDRAYGAARVSAETVVVDLADLLACGAGALLAAACEMRAADERASVRADELRRRQ